MQTRDYALLFRHWPINTLDSFGHPSRSIHPATERSSQAKHLTKNTLVGRSPPADGRSSRDRPILVPPSPERRHLSQVPFPVGRRHERRFGRHHVPHRENRRRSSSAPGAHEDAAKFIVRYGRRRRLKGVDQRSNTPGTRTNV